MTKVILKNNCDYFGTAIAMIKWMVINVSISAIDYEKLEINQNVTLIVIFIVST